MDISSVVARLNRNKFFKFISSVRLAVPLMLILSTVVAVGTVFESQYNADYAKILIYQTSWFYYLLGLLWLNIFCATLSRVPFKKHHTGFVITHIGLLTLLIGSMITGAYGIDGQLQVPEGRSQSTVYLPDLTIGYEFEGGSPQAVSFRKRLRPMTNSDLASINEQFQHLFQIESYLPFVQMDRIAVKDASLPNDSVALSFILKSRFFNVSEWLNTKDTPELQMGPARLRLVTGQLAPKPQKEKSTKVKKSAATTKNQASSNPSPGSLTVSDGTKKQVLKEISLTALKKGPVRIGAVEIRIEKVFTRALVAENKIVEGDPQDPQVNPALELTLAKDGKKQREVVYARYPDFSLNKEGNFGLSFRYTVADAEPASPVSETIAPGMAAHGGGQDSAGNVIEFHVPPEGNEVDVQLFKNGKLVMSALRAEGQTLETPWMGMTITVGTLIRGGRSTIEARAVQPTKSESLPPSGIKIRPRGSEETFWLSEGQSETFNMGNRNLRIFFDRENLNLPFNVDLQKFTKRDYPGTGTPMSFESLVKVDGQNEPILISMNEPLKKDGFTIYQASYVMQPGQPAISVFSVNRDPGRPIKYAGSLILGLGIIIFTIMRSRLWKQRFQKGN